MLRGVEIGMLGRICICWANLHMMRWWCTRRCKPCKLVVDVVYWVHFVELHCVQLALVFR